MKRVAMRYAMTLIELLFAIIIIGISVMTIPSMMSVAGESSKMRTVDEDVMSRLAGWTLEKFQARWDGNYSASGSPIISINEGGLACEMRDGRWYRDNNASTVECNSSVVNPVISPIPDGNGTVSAGIEQLSGGTETLPIAIQSGGSYNVNATYKVSYVSSAPDAINNNVISTTWVLGASGNTNPSPSGVSNLKRVVTTFYDTTLDVNTTLTFFKSNKGN